MIENIKNVFRRTLTSSPWMDDKSRAAALDKVDFKLILSSFIYMRVLIEFRKKAPLRIAHLEGSICANV